LNIAFNDLTLLVWYQEEHPACNKICLEHGANDLHMMQLMPLPPHCLIVSLKSRMGFAFLIPAYPGCPGKEAVKQASV